MGSMLYGQGRVLACQASGNDDEQLFDDADAGQGAL